MSTGVNMAQEGQFDHQSKSWADLHNIEPQGFSTNIGEKFFGDDSPNKTPVVDVDVKLAADIIISDNPELVKEVAEYWFPEDTDRFKSVAKVVFNDGSVWHIPLPDWNKDYEGFRVDLVERFIPDVVQWKALVRGDDPSEALSRFREELNVEHDTSWEKELDDTEYTDEQRKWFNDNLDHVDYLQRTVESTSDSDNLDIGSDSNWEDDW